ncbi:MAG: hypothetical protein R3Y04_04630 [Rikenellaceae bacterium]
MYGENGSGKSSIYYALHCIFNSIHKKDQGRKYFDITNVQNLINRNALTEGEPPYVIVNYKQGVRSPFISIVSGTDCTCDSSLREISTCFINHQFLFSFFNFKNSNNVNLFPVFQHEILPYVYSTEDRTYIGELYDNIKIESTLLGNKKSTKDIKAKINIFNKAVSNIVDLVNYSVNDVYKEYFQSESDKDLDIKLFYPDTDDLYDQTNLTGYRLKYERQRIVGTDGAEVYNSNKTLNIPLIRLQITEDGNIIPKPQTYFNEAKRTAIALSIRFALLDINETTPPKGSFLALDDMLISLDMSNRTKVINFLLSISDKYKVYLFTHNRAFFELVKEKIDIKNDKDNWIYKELYQNDKVKENPICLDSDDSYTRAMAHFHKCDFPAAANYLRKSVEELMSMMPHYISKKDDGSAAEKLRTKVDATKCLLQRLDGDVSDINEIVSALNLLLNPLSHRSIDTDVYRVDLKKVFEVIPRLKAHIKELDIKEVMAKTKHVFLTVQENATTKCEIEIELTEAIYSFLKESGTRVLSSAKGNSIQSKTIKDGEDPGIKPHKYNTGTLEETCNAIHRMCGKSYTCSYWDFYTNENNVSITSL